MLPQAAMSRNSHCPRRWSVWNVGGLLTLVAFLASVAFAAPAPAPKDDTKKETTKKDDSSKESTKKENASKDGTKKGSPGGIPGGPGGPAGFAVMRHAMRLGAQVEPASEELADQLDLPKGKGLVVKHVIPNSPAEKAGFKANDVILEINGKSVSNRMDELAHTLSEIKPDTSIEMVVLRKGKKETLKEIKLPEVKGVPSGGFNPGIGVRPGLQPGFNGGGMTVMTTLMQTGDHFVLTHQEGNIVIRLNGTCEDGKPKVKEVFVIEAGRNEKYESVDKVPEKHQDKVKSLVEMSEKAPAKSKAKSEGEKKREAK